MVGTAWRPAIRARRTSGRGELGERGRRWSVTRSSDVVVEGEQHPVTARVHVGLEVAVAERHRVPERLDGVLEGRAGRDGVAPPR